MKSFLLVTALIISSLAATQSLAADIAPAHKTELKSDKAALCDTPAGKHTKACATVTGAASLDAAAAHASAQ